MIPLTPPPTPAQLLETPRPLVIAHRGYSGAAPENTVPAFELAARAGADLIELDYHHSADGIPVVVHDFTLDRTTDAVALWGAPKVAPKTKTAAEIATLDAGKWFAPRYAGTRIPTLEQAIDFINRNSVTLIERKSGDAAALVKLLREKQALGTVMVQAFDWNFLRDCHQIAPDLILGALGPPSTRNGVKLEAKDKVLSADYLDEIQKTGARVVVWNSQITPEIVDETHRRGLKVWAYTIDEVAKAQSILTLGVDGVITNEPPLIWKAIALAPAK